MFNKIKTGLFSFGLFSILVVGMVIPANLYLFSWRILDLSRHDYPYYLDSAEVEMMELLEEEIPEDSVILSSYNIGMYLPGLSGRTAFFSHWAQTVNYFEKRDFVNGFYSNELTDTQSKDYLLEYGIGVCFVRPFGEGVRFFKTGSIGFS